MKQELLRFGAGSAETSLNPLTGLIIVLACLLVIFLPRRYVIIPLLLVSFLIPLGQVIVIAGLHFMMFRIVIMGAVVRVALTEFPTAKASGFRMNVIDKLFVCWMISSVITFTLLWGESGAFVQKMGSLIDACGCYFVLRLLYRNFKDIDRSTKVISLVCVVVAVCMIGEVWTGKNVFHVFGGVPEFADIREGRLRAQGPFRHPILAGTFGATLLPLFIGLWWQKSKARVVAAMGMVSCTVIAVTAASSTAMGAYVAGIAAILFWPLRKHLRWFRWAVVASLAALQIVMKAPVWALIERVDLVGGSSGYHRYFLVDQFIRRVGEWWLFGTKSTNSWGWDMWDTSNQYVEIGVSGGILTFALFLAVLVYCFKRLGIARKSVPREIMVQRRLWCLGAALFSHLVAFVGITYFDQTIISLYALIAMISSATSFALMSSRTQSVPTKAPARYLKFPDYSDSSPELIQT
jgi:hypothetical protein